MLKECCMGRSSWSGPIFIWILYKFFSGLEMAIVISLPIMRLKLSASDQICTYSNLSEEIYQACIFFNVSPQSPWSCTEWEAGFQTQRFLLISHWGILILPLNTCPIFFCNYFLLPSCMPKKADHADYICLGIEEMVLTKPVSGEEIETYREHTTRGILLPCHSFPVSTSGPLSLSVSPLYHTFLSVLTTCLITFLVLKNNLLLSLQSLQMHPHL